MAEEETPQPEQTPPDEEPQVEAPAGGEQEAAQPDAAETSPEGAEEETSATEGEAVAEAEGDGTVASDETEASEVAAGDPDGTPMDLPSFEPADTESDEAKIEFLSDVNLKVKVELGRTRMYVEDVLRLTPGSVVELDKPAGDPVDIYVNDRHVARGEVLVVNENFCVRINEILQQLTVDV